MPQELHDEKRQEDASPLLSALHIIGLSSLAFAQPLFELLAKTSDFFVVRRSEPLDILLLVSVLSLGLPFVFIGVETALHLISTRAGKVVHGITILGLLAIIALQALKRIEQLPPPVMIATAIALAAVGLISTLRLSLARVFLTTLSASALLFPALFLLNPGIAAILHPKQTVSAPAIDTAAQTPIVLIVFDELPLTSLLNEHQDIDPIRYPHFAALVQHSSWFRNATTVGDFTTAAVPAILTGLYPQDGLAPVAADHPNSLFTLLGGVYDFNVYEALTQLCPDYLSGRSAESLWLRLRSLASDLLIVYFHLLLPTDMAAALPPVTQNWFGFSKPQGGREAQPVDRLLAEAAFKKDRVQVFANFLDGIRPGADNTLSFLHILLPHPPYEFMPSGKRYSTETDVFGEDKATWNKWSSDHWAVLQNYQRHLLQLGYTDKMLGALVSHLRACDQYDRSLLIVVADHGVSYRAGDFRRVLTDTNVSDIASVPLIIKFPYQDTAIVSDINVQTIDIIPTIASVLNVDLPWSADGHSLTDSTQFRSQEKVIFRKYPVDPQPLRVQSSTLEESRAASVKRKIGVFGSGSRPNGLFAIGPFPELIGQSVHDVGVRDDSPVDIDVASQVLADDRDHNVIVPAHLVGTVRSGEGAEHLRGIAIAVNGVVWATTQLYTIPPHGRNGEWSAVVDEAAFLAGNNQVEVFDISILDGRPVLRRGRSAIDVTSSPSFGGRRILGVEESGFWSQEWGKDGTPFRWTNGSAKLVVPIDSGSPPSAVRIALRQSEPGGTRLEIRVDGVPVFEGPISPGAWAKTVSLAGRTLRDRATIEIISGGFVPSDVNPGSPDTRTLGVAVDSVFFVKGEDRRAAGQR